MTATSVRPLNQTAQEGHQESLIWGVTMEMLVVVAEEAMIRAATAAEAGDGEGFRGGRVVGTEVALVLASPSCQG